MRARVGEEMAPQFRWGLLLAVLVSATVGSVAIVAGGPSLLESQVLCSEVNGAVTRGAQPVVGAGITRRSHWASTDGSDVDTTVTDGEGRFYLPRVTGTSFMARWLPMSLSLPRPY